MCSVFTTVAVTRDEGLSYKLLSLECFGGKLLFSWDVVQVKGRIQALPKIHTVSPLSCDLTDSHKGNSAPCDVRTTSGPAVSVFM